MTMTVEARRLSNGRPKTLFGLQDWTQWLDSTARSLFGMSGPAFEHAYYSRTIDISGEVEDVASVLPLIQRLRQLK